MQKARNTESRAKFDWDKNLSLLCEAVDQYALQWTKREMVELSVLSSWKEMVKGQIEERISKLKQNFKQPTGKALQNADVTPCQMPSEDIVNTHDTFMKSFGIELSVR